jgi:hypothetical protein
MSVQTLGTIIAVGSLTLLTLVTVLILRILSQSLNSALAHADRIHERNATQLETTLDRLMAVDFSEFKSQQMTEHAPKGEYVEPDTEILVPVKELGIE